MRQECREKERVIALQGGSLRPSAAGYLLFFLSLRSPSLSSFPPISPAVYEGTQSVSLRVGVCTPGTRQRNTMYVHNNTPHFSFNSIVTLYFIFMLCIAYVVIVALLLLHAPRIRLFFQKYANMTHTHVHNKQKTHTQKGSLMDSEDSNFPSATKDRKSSELNYPCLTHKNQTRPQAHMHAHTSDTSSHAHTHTHAHLKLQ